MNLFEIVKKAIDEWDSYNLLKMGCPNDEYDIESKEIANKLNCENNIQDIAYIISDIFSNSFDDPKRFSVENCIEVANKIKTLMENNTDI